ncbi:hypothetical protein NPS70_04145 [Streptomyces sp. C10-9-1]|uniref:hypothetical protein n=1 Tax=Streptomyces sp. C10-9-1 TaxID=1859285 RepID=UPI0021130C27|nr:hypothetical protein [Streptomyces sp. C10-9-1]MCQ6552393.1 hypothetical protein [Streptomyces sp. C10-9-1]
MSDADRMRISRVPGKPVRRDRDGGLVVDLWLTRAGAFATDLPLRLTPDEAEVLHAQLCFALDDVPLPEAGQRVPDCRGPARAPTLRWP